MDRDPGAAGGRIDERVLRALSGRTSHLAFSSLRRDLDAHPESLTRSLRRLERLGSIGHDALGYFLLEPSEEVRPLSVFRDASELATVRLPPAIGPTTLFGLLAGRWFGEVRWVGSFEERGGASLAWEIPGVDGLLLARWDDGRLRIACEHPKGSPPDERLVRAGEDLLASALRRVRGVTGPVSPFEDGRNGAALPLAAASRRGSAFGYAA